jgi:hypothetical protein
MTQRSRWLVVNTSLVLGSDTRCFDSNGNPIVQKNVTQELMNFVNEIRDRPDDANLHQAIRTDPTLEPVIERIWEAAYENHMRGGLNTVQFMMADILARNNVTPDECLLSSVPPSLNELRDIFINQVMQFANEQEVSTIINVLKTRTTPIREAIRKRSCDTTTPCPVQMEYFYFASPPSSSSSSMVPSATSTYTLDNHHHPDNAGPPSSS